jgi:hypothetical protein
LTTDDDEKAIPIVIRDAGSLCEKLRTPKFPSRISAMSLRGPSADVMASGSKVGVPLDSRPHWPFAENLRGLTGLELESETAG